MIIGCKWNKLWRCSHQGGAGFPFGPEVRIQFGILPMPNYPFRHHCFLFLHDIMTKTADTLTFFELFVLSHRNLLVLLAVSHRQCNASILAIST